MHSKGGLPILLSGDSVRASTLYVEPTAQKELTRMPLSGPIRVLSVDDHTLIRDGIAFALQQQKDMVLVAAAKNGREAVELFRANKPDITLMDLQMPVMNGL